MLVNPLKPVRKQKGLRDQVYDSIRKSLQEGKISPSEVLREVDLAKMLGVSRTPVREALALLEGDGILEAASKGYAVRRLSQSEIADVFEIRRLLEPYALKTYLPSIDEKTLERLEDALDAQAQAHQHGDVEAFSQSNSRFRNGWIDRLESAHLREAIHKYDHYVRYIQLVTLANPDARETIITSLSGIMKAIKVGDSAAVGELVFAHLGHAEKWTLKASSDAA